MSDSFRKYDGVSREELLKMQVRNNSYELREFRRQLDKDYISKSQLHQNEEYHSKQTLNKKKEELEERQQLKHIENCIEKEQIEKCENDKLKSHHMAQGLLLQIDEQDQQRETEILESKSDRFLIDQAVEEMLAEESKNMKERQQKLSIHRKTIEQQISEKQLRSTLEKQREIERYKNEQARVEEEARKNDDDQRKRQEKLEEKQQIQSQLMEKLHKLNVARQEDEYLRLEQAEEKKIQEDDMVAKQEVEKQKRIIADLRRGIEHQLNEHMEKLITEDHEQRALERKLMDTWAEQQRLAEMTREAQRRCKAELKRQAELAIKERRKRQQQEIQQLHKEYRQLQEMDEERNRVIAKERAELLREHTRRLEALIVAKKHEQR